MPDGMEGCHTQYGLSLDPFVFDSVVQLHMRILDAEQ